MMQLSLKHVLLDCFQLHMRGVLKHHCVPRPTPPVPLPPGFCKTRQLLSPAVFVDVQEFFTFDGAVLRTNICMSMTGSFLYIVGSVVSRPKQTGLCVNDWRSLTASQIMGYKRNRDIEPHMQMRLVLSDPDRPTVTIDIADGNPETALCRARCSV